MSMEDDFIEFEQAGVRANSLTPVDDPTGEQYRKLSTAYRAFVTGQAGKAETFAVMDDLMTFCRVFETTVPAAGRVPVWPQEVLEGRRQVALRILEFSRLSPDELFRRYHKG